MFKNVYYESNSIMKKHSIYRQESGFVSIIVSLVIMIVLTLIVLGFAQLARREQRAALDRELSSEAYYAAESGILAVKSFVTNNMIDTNVDKTKSTCDNTWPASLTSHVPTVNNVLDAPTGQVKFTCVLYDANPTFLLFGAVDTNKVSLVTIKNPGLSSLQIYWQANNGSSNFSSKTPGNFSPTCVTNASPPPSCKTGTWDSGTGVLRVMLVSRDNLSRDTFRNKTFTGYLYPDASATAGQNGTMDFTQGLGANSSGLVAGGKCNTGNTTRYFCRVDITNMDPTNTSGYVLVLRSVYDTNAVSICINNTGCTGPINGAQVLVDSTGKANDVIRRVQARFTISSGIENLLPIGLVSNESLCKQIVLNPSDPPYVTQGAAGSGSCSLP